PCRPCPATCGFAACLQCRPASLCAGTRPRSRPTCRTSQPSAIRCAPASHHPSSTSRKWRCADWQRACRSACSAHPDLRRGGLSTSPCSDWALRGPPFDLLDDLVHFRQEAVYFLSEILDVLFIPVHALDEQG